jgi:hypothetical protein
MVRALIQQKVLPGIWYCEFAGLSSDEKPNENLLTGSKFQEVDTGIIYLFDEESATWTPSNAGNGKTNIAGATVVLGSAIKYDGTKQTKEVSSVKIGSTTLTENTDYVVKDNKETEVGDYTLHIVGIGSYTGIIAKDWSIAKGDGSVSASPDSLSLTAEGDNGTSTLTVTGDGPISVSSSAEAVATAEVSNGTVTVHPLTAGSATITVALAESGNYTGASDTIAVTVAEAEGGE